MEVTHPFHGGFQVILSLLVAFYHFFFSSLSTFLLHDSLLNILFDKFLYQRWCLDCQIKHEASSHILYFFWLLICQLESQECHWANNILVDFGWFFIFFFGCLVVARIMRQKTSNFDIQSCAKVASMLMYVMEQAFVILICTTKQDWMPPCLISQVPLCLVLYFYRI